MNDKKILQILSDTAYVRTGGSAEELHCAEYIRQCCVQLGMQARLEPFPVEMATIEMAQLQIDGTEIPCKGYLCAGNGEVEAPLYYLTGTDPYALSQCRGKIVMIDGYMRYWLYRDLLKNGAVGFITYDGNANYTDDDIDQRELRSYVSMGEKIPGVNINAKSAIRIINKNGIMAKIVLKQTETMGSSHNVVLDLPGEIPEMLIFSAHYDSTSLSQGAYDNMSGSIGLLGIAEYFLQHPHRYSLRFVWCGSEERGLLGSKAYTEAHADELEQLVLNINLDMIGSIMGGLTVRCTAEEKVVHYLEYLAAELGVSLSAKQEIHSSDSTSFADKGIPAVSFARRAPSNTATIHNAYDTKAVLKAAHLQADIAFITAFAQRMANASRCPVSREIPENMKEKLDVYLLRKRG